MTDQTPERSTSPMSAMTEPVAREHLLTTKQMADFVADGMLVFPDMVPEEINAAAREEMSTGSFNEYRSKQLFAGRPLFECWPDTPGLGALLRMPQVRGLIQSLVGCAPLYDHYAFHMVKEHSTYGQHWHADAIIDTRLESFDVQLFYYSHDTPREMGGTMFLPGSHFRRVSESDISRYQNFVGQMPMVCKAGTVAIAHHGIWHCAQPNHTGQTRYMFKLRLNPTVPQVKLWNTDDLQEQGVLGGMGKHHLWYGNEDRLEVVNRIKFWRALVGDDKFDLGYWLSRLENQPHKQNVS